MRNLIQKITPLILAGAGIVGCATSHPTQVLTEAIKPNPIISSSKTNDKGIDLKNEFFTESYKVTDNILLLTEVFLGESMLKKTKEGYEGVETHSYHTTPTEIFDRTYDEFCEAIDNGDKFLTEIETERFLDKVYEARYGMIWAEDE